MKKLLFKIFLLVFLVASIMLFPLLFHVSTDDPSYGAAIIDKHKLLRDTKPPRIIFIGGSNLAFGLDSKLVEEAMGMRTVNMGLNAGLGLRYILSEVEPYIRKNDIIVIIPEYEHFFGTSFDGDGSLSWFFYSFPENRKYVKSWKQYFVILRNYPVTLRSRLFSLLIGSKSYTFFDYCKFDYCRKAFNEYGDAVGHLNKEHQVSVKNKCYEFGGETNKDVVPELNKFKSYTEKMGAMVFFIYPCLIDAQYKKNEKKINLLCDGLKRKLEIPVLSAPLDYVFPEIYFYDTIYHLTGEGRKIRTQKVIADLKKALLSSSQSMEKIVFLGDSLTKGGDWESLFNHPGIVNCGLDGDTTIGVLSRIDKVVAKKPDKIFLMIGINDYLTIKSKSVILKNYKIILEKLQKSLPKASIYVQSILPVNSRLFTASVWNKDIEGLNKSLEQLCKQNRVEYINLSQDFIKDGQLDGEYTNDGLHLNNLGYNLWRDLIKEYVTAETGSNR